MIVIVTGGRDYAGTGLVEALDALERENPGFFVIAAAIVDERAAAQAWEEVQR